MPFQALPLASIFTGTSVAVVEDELDFERGASKGVVTALAVVAGIVKREFTPSGERPLLGVLDGSAALRKAVPSFPSLVSSVV